jgi:hypothetical protein
MQRFTVGFGMDWILPTMSALLLFCYLPNTPFYIALRMFVGGLT